MKGNLTARATTSIHATTDEVWKALVTPEVIKHYMFGADVDSDWRVGSPITWKGEMKGKPYEDKGVILAFEPGRTLKYSHFSPLSGKPDKPENYHTVTIALAEAWDETKVYLLQDKNTDEKACEESAKNWAAMLEGLKEVVEEGGSSDCPSDQDASTGRAH